MVFFRAERFSVINESGLYTAILYSRRPEAKAFRRKVTSEILPSIRKHGGYIKGQEKVTDDELMARALMLAQSKLEENGDNHKRSGRRGQRLRYRSSWGLRYVRPRTRRRINVDCESFELATPKPFWNNRGGLFLF